MAGEEIMEQAMVVVFPQDDPKVCQVSFRVGVPLLLLQSASIDQGRMRFGERSSVDLRHAGDAVADGEKVSILSRPSAGQQPHLLLELHMDDNAEIQAWTTALRSAIAATGNAKLDGAMQMLEALEDMLEQQRKSIAAQKAAISALKEEVEEEEEEEEGEESGDQVDAEDVSPEKLLALFQQAEQMEQAAGASYRALKQIEALGKAGLLQGGPAGAAGAAGAAGSEDGDVEAIISRLHALEEQKANFERMVAQQSK
eukprot:Skav201753  [mRNA]  locus=scaffold1973:106111:111643:- [translate_table: standard]